MSFIGGGFGVGTGPSSGLRFAQTRGRISGTPVQGVNYPSPFFDIAHTYLPVTVKQLFRWCRYYFLTNPLINATVFKLSEYPITDIIIDHENSSVVKRWTEYFQDHLRYRPFQVECGLDYHTYGNGMVSLAFPFKKYLRCAGCGFEEQAQKIRARWTFTSFSFRLSCPRCGLTGDAIAADQYLRNASGVKLLRWNCEYVEVTYNDVSGETIYFYTIPPTVRNDIVIGKKDVVESTPQVFIQALKEQKGVVLSKDNFFHLKRPTLAQQDRGWGIPLVLPVLKDTFYLQLMKKAQEAILIEHIVPLRILFPQAGSGSSDPYCVAPDTLVETPTGLIPAAEVRSGDYLRSHTGAWRNVEATKRRDVGVGEKTYRFKVASLAAFPFTVAEDHPILAVPRISKKKPRIGLVDPSFIEAKKLQAGDYVAYPVKRTVRGPQQIDLGEYLADRAVTDEWVYRRLGQEVAEIYEWMEQNDDPKFGWGERRKVLDQHGWSEQNYATAAAMRIEDKIDRIARYLPVNQYLADLVGWYLSEGSVGDGGMVSFSLHLNENHFAADIDRDVQELGFRGVCHYERPEQNGRSIVINDVLLSELLASMCGTGFAGKRIPDVLTEAEDHLVLRMLRSVFAGDGTCFSTETKRLGLKMANPSVVLEARRLILSFGYIGGIMKEEPTETSKFKTTAYQLNFNGEVADRVAALLSGSVDPLPRPAQRSGLVRGDYVLLRIDALDEVQDVPEVIGFQMSGDRSFCVAGVATHNTTINLVDWRDHVAAEIARWRHDNNYIPIMPLPVGNQTIGGDGRALLLTQEIQAWSEQIMVGMGVPREFLLGGMSYAGTNVSMRMLENAFIGYILRHKQMAKWVMKMVAAYMDWPEVNIRFKPFRMADDIQRKAYLFQLNQAGKVSDTTLLADADFKQDEEDDIMLRETDKRIEATKKQQLAMAQIQGESQVIMAKASVKAQQVTQAAMGAPQAPGEPGGPEDSRDAMGSPLNAGQNMSQEGQTQAGGDIHQMAKVLAEQASQLPPDQQNLAIQNLEAQSPELAQLVRRYMSDMQKEEAPAKIGVPGVDMRAMPEQRPPRRAAAMV